MKRTKSYIQTPVADMSRAIAFYKQAFALTPVMESAYWTEFQLADSVTLALHGGMRGGVEMGLGFEVDDVAAAVAEVRAAGGTVIKPAEDKPEEGISLATVADPDGNHISLARPLH